jgi:predicted phage gp36 major capsid-like protein
LSAPAIPSDAAGLMDTLSDPVKLKAIIDSPEGMTGFTKQFKDAFEARDKGTVAEQQQIEMQRTFIQMMRDAGLDGEVKRLNQGDPELLEAHAHYASHKQGTAYNKSAVGVSQDKEFKGAADFFKSIWHLNPDMQTRARVEALRASYGSTVPSDGGFLIPETLRPTCCRWRWRPRSSGREPPSSRWTACVCRSPTIDETTHAGSVYGGMVGYWTEEAGALSETEAKFGRVVLEAKKLTGYSEVPNELFNDSIVSFQAFLNQVWPQAIAFFEDLAFFSGTGAGEPLGFIGAGNTAGVSVTAESGQATNTIVWENVLEMYARMLPTSLGRAVWLYSPNAFRELATMALSVGTGGGPVWLNNGQDGPPMRILGRPAFPTEKCNTLGTRGDLVFADLSYYMVGDRQAMTAESSTDYRFGNDETVYRIIQRVDGRPWLQNAITPANGGPTLSAFVELATRP